MEMIKPPIIFNIIDVPKRNKSMPRYIGLREKRNRPSVTRKVDFLRLSGLIVVLLSIKDFTETIKSNRPKMLTTTPSSSL